MSQNNSRDSFKPMTMDDMKKLILEEEEDEGAISVPMSELAPEDLSKEQLATLESLMDIPVTISMEVGRSEITIRNLLQLNQGSVVELERLAGEPLDVLVNGMLLAHGEVVVVNDKFGIRLTDVISLTERIKKIK
jgi:flagellar motor switch protein FliN/FliY